MGTFLENKVLKAYKISKPFYNKSWSPSPIFLKYFIFKRFNQFSTLKNDFENQNFGMLEEVVHNFGKSDSDII